MSYGGQGKGSYAQDNMITCIIITIIHIIIIIIIIIMMIVVIIISVGIIIIIISSSSSIIVIIILSMYGIYHAGSEQADSDKTCLFKCSCRKYNLFFLISPVRVSIITPPYELNKNTDNKK